MLVAGYVVLVFPEDVKERGVFYGTFNDLDSAHKWAEVLTGIVTIHPVYATSMNRG